MPSSTCLPNHQFVVFISTLAHLLLLASCFSFSFSFSFTNHHQHSSPFFPRALLFEEKTRLGSTPPSCYNKCNRCHPCLAVQVPTLNHKQSQPKVRSKMELLPPSSSSSESISNNRYSNYKPLGWKCRCGDHIFNP